MKPLSTNDLWPGPVYEGVRDQFRKEVIEAMARQIGELFHLFARRLGLDGDLPPYDCGRFRPPLPRSGQLRLF